MTLDPDRPCHHPDFRVHADISRLVADGAVESPDTPAVGFTTEIRVWCAVCDEPFCWVGAYLVGLDPRGPRIDPSAQELRAPIRPRSAEPDFGLGLPGFQVREV